MGGGSGWRERNVDVVEIRGYWEGGQSGRVDVVDSGGVLTGSRVN